MQKLMAERGSIVAVVLAVAVGAFSCTTGDTGADERSTAIRNVVLKLGVTEDVATCVVDELEATVGISVLDDTELTGADADEAALQVNEILTNCLLDGPISSTTGPAGAGGSDATSEVVPPSSEFQAPSDPDSYATTTGLP